MFGNEHRIGRLLLVLVTALLAAQLPGAARAQDDEIVDDAPAVPKAVNLGQVAAVPNLDQVDQWVFGRMGGTSEARGRLESALAIRIDDVERACGISEAQKKKLKVAGQGDIKRFYDRVEDVKRKFVRMSTGLEPNVNIWQDVQPMQNEIYIGLFGDDSMLHKTIQKTLSDEQRARYDALIAQRTQERRHATIELFIGHLDKALGLTDDQRTRLTSLFEREIPPPLKMGQADYWYFMFRTSKLPESTLKPIFDAPQWRLLSRQFPQAQGMEQWLKNAGVIAGGPVADRSGFREVMSKKGAPRPARVIRDVIKSK
jgi:hypothetical protein